MSSSSRGGGTPRADAYLTRLMGGLFAVGAAGFVVGPLAAYTNHVGARGDAITFFLASILFTGGGLAQSWLAYPERRDHRSGRLAWHGAWIQAVGTLLFNYMTFEAISHAASDAQYTMLVWVPNVLGSACFLASGVLLYWSAPPVGWRPARRVAGWWEPPANLLGCVLFGMSAVAGYASSGRLLSSAAANWTTSLGAACFLALGLAPLIVGMSFKIPRLSRLTAFERLLQRDLAGLAHEVDLDAWRASRTVERATAEVRLRLEQEVSLVEGDGG